MNRNECDHQEMRLLGEAQHARRLPSRRREGLVEVLGGIGPLLVDHLGRGELQVGIPRFILHLDIV